MTVAEIHVGDIQSRFIITIRDENSGLIDLTGASVLQIIFHKPDGSIIIKTASLYTDGTDGKCYYSTISSSDLDQEGLYKIQAYVELSGGGKYHSDIDDFQVYPNLN